MLYPASTYARILSSILPLFSCIVSSIQLPIKQTFLHQYTFYLAALL